MITRMSASHPNNRSGPRCWRARSALLLVLWLLAAGFPGSGSLRAGLIGYLEQTNDHRFEPWVGDDPSYSEDPLSVLGPPLSPLALFPWMWQRHHPGDVVSRHTLESLDAEVVRPGPPLEAASRETKSSRVAGPWGTRRKMLETHRELFGEQSKSAEGAEGDRERGVKPTVESGRGKSKSVDDGD